MVGRGDEAAMGITLSGVRGWFDGADEKEHDTDAVE